MTHAPPNKAEAQGTTAMEGCEHLVGHKGSSWTKDRNLRRFVWYRHTSPANQGHLTTKDWRVWREGHNKSMYIGGYWRILELEKILVVTSVFSVCCFQPACPPLTSFSSSCHISDVSCSTIYYFHLLPPSPA